LLHLRGRLSDLQPLIGTLSESLTPGMREVAALVLADVDRIDEARSCLAGNAPLARDFTYTQTLCARAEAIARTAADGLAEACRDELEPFAGQIGVVTASASLGAVDYFLGRLAETCGEHERAAEHFRAAIDVNTRGGAHVFVPWSRARLALALIAVGDRSAERLFADAHDEALRLGVAPMRRDTPH
jgi:hypothetical protein